MTVKEVVPINSRKFKVIFEENYSIPLYKTEIRRYNIEAGRELEDSDMNEIHKTLISRIKNRILYLLEDSDKSIHTIKSKMRFAGYPDDIVDEVTELFTEYGYLDDKRYARNYISSMSIYMKKSKKAIITAVVITGLYSKGISREIIDGVIEEYEFGDRELILDTLRKKGYTQESLAEIDFSVKKSLISMLLRRGFEYEEICSIFKYMS